MCVLVAGGLIVLTARSAAFYNTDIMRSDNFMSFSWRQSTRAPAHAHLHVHRHMCVHTYVHAPAALTHTVSALSWAHKVARRGLYL